MKAHRDFTTLVTAERELRDNYRVLSGCVFPRPIALVSTVSVDGVANLAPFSFFNAVCAKPPAVMFCPGTRRDGSFKDTLNNVRSSGEFVVNVVSHSIREAMNQAAFDFEPDVDEFAEAGFATLPSRFVSPPRVAESPVHMECKLLQIVPIGEGPHATHMCIGEVVCFHVAEGCLLPDGTVDAAALDLVGRLGGDDYATTRERLTLARPASPGR